MRYNIEDVPTVSRNSFLDTVVIFPLVASRDACVLALGRVLAHELDTVTVYAFREGHRFLGYVIFRGFAA